MKRVFIAIDISENARRQAQSHIERLRAAFPRLRVGWERPEKLHITLKFLGDVSHEQIADIEAQVRAAASQNSPFNARLVRTGVFPERGIPRILWIGIKPHAEIAALASVIEEGCAKLGFEREKRQFSPHLTIARLREPKVSHQLAKAHCSAQFDPVEFRIDEITIYESKLHPAGSIYEKLGAFPLNPNLD